MPQQVEQKVPCGDADSSWCQREMTDVCMSYITLEDGEKAKGKPKRLKTYPKEEIKDEDGVFDAQFPAAQSRHPCDVSPEFICCRSPGSWFGSVRFGSIRPHSCHTDGGALRWCRSPRIQSDLFRKRPQRTKHDLIDCCQTCVLYKIAYKM